MHFGNRAPDFCPDQQSSAVALAEHKVGKSRCLGFGVLTEFAHHRVGSVHYVNVRHLRLVGNSGGFG
jgi:hypothetical protein